MANSISVYDFSVPSTYFGNILNVMFPTVLIIKQFEVKEVVG